METRHRSVRRTQRVTRWLPLFCDGAASLRNRSLISRFLETRGRASCRQRYPGRCPAVRHVRRGCLSAEQGAGFLAFQWIRLHHVGLSADLYLVDPAYSCHRELDRRRVREVSKKFCERSSRALIWYPVFVKERPLDDLTGVVIAEVRWTTRGANQVMRGCGVIAFGAASGILYEMRSPLSQLAASLSGSLCLRDQRA